MSKLPIGLDGCHDALAYHTESHRLLEYVTALIWLRILTDPSCPLIGGHDPRTILDPPIYWDELSTYSPWLVAILCSRLNMVMGEDLLPEDWHELPPESVARAVEEIGRWQMPAGDPLGVAYGSLTSRSKADGIGSFYTPYHVSLMMAMMTAPGPGETVCDPCCGSGGMLLAALEACRTEHGPDAVCEVFGTDIDPDAVRLARLNLALAGIAPGGRAHPVDALAAVPPPVGPALAAARQEWEETQLPLFDS